MCIRDRSCSLSHGTTRLDRGRVGEVGDRAAHQDLLIDASRARTAARRIGAVESFHHRRRKDRGPAVIPDRLPLHRRLRRAFFPVSPEREIADELRAHIELQTRRYVAEGTVSYTHLTLPTSDLV